jgi:hypothetical protein
MKDIAVFEIDKEKYKYTLWATFDSEEELDFWLTTTCKNKDNLLIMKQLKRR